MFSQKPQIPHVCQSLNFTYMRILFCTSKTNPPALRQVRLAPSRPQTPSLNWVPFWCPSRFIRVCNRPQTTSRDICHTDAAWVATVAVNLEHFLSILHENVTFELPRLKLCLKMDKEWARNRPPHLPHTPRPWGKCRGLPFGLCWRPEGTKKSTKKGTRMSHEMP